MKLAVTLALATLALCGPGSARKAPASHKNLAATQEDPHTQEPVLGAPPILTSKPLTKGCYLSLTGPAFASQADPARELPSWDSVADSAESCLDFIMKTFFVSLFSSHEVSMELFSPDADMRDMASKIKGLVDTLPQQDQDSIRRGMDKILKKPTVCLGFRS